jgi:hypothetical protein
MLLLLPRPRHASLLLLHVRCKFEAPGVTTTTKVVTRSKPKFLWRQVNRRRARRSTGAAMVRPAELQRQHAARFRKAKEEEKEKKDGAGPMHLVKVVKGPSMASFLSFGDMIQANKVSEKERGAGACGAGAGGRVRRGKRFKGDVGKDAFLATSQDKQIPR